MAEARIPVDLLNPGQVFACLGFMEAADVLLGEAEGAFDWSGDPAFVLRAAGDENPVARVLAFLAEAEVKALTPAGDAFGTTIADVPTMPPASQDAFPFPPPEAGKASTLPAVLCGPSGHALSVSHWADATGRDTFKTFAGQQIGCRIAASLLDGDPKVKASRGVRRLVARLGATLADDPFGAVCATGGSFNFDARAAWDALRIGTSLDEQKDLTGLSPLVDLMAAVGLQNARPEAVGPYELRYAAWSVASPLSLTRALLAHPEILPGPGLTRRFRAHLGSDKYYKKFFFAVEETPR